MKANKALKRLAKIEALTSDVAKRFSAHAPHMREVFEDLKAAVDRVKEAVRVQASSGTAKKKVAPLKTAPVAKKAAPVRKKAAVRKAAVKAPTAKTAKKRAPVKKVAKRKAAKRKAPVSVEAAMAATAQESMPAPAEVE